MKIYRCFFTFISICLIIVLSGFTGSQKTRISGKQVIVTTKLKNVSPSDIQRVEKEAKKALASVCPILGIKYNDPIRIRIVKDAISSSIGGVITLDINRIKAKKAPIVHEVTHIIAEHDDNRFFAERTTRGQTRKKRKRK